MVPANIPHECCIQGVCKRPTVKKCDCQSGLLSFWLRKADTNTKIVEKKHKKNIVETCGRKQRHIGPAKRDHVWW